MVIKLSSSKLLADFFTQGSVEKSKPSHITTSTWQPMAALQGQVARFVQSGSPEGLEPDIQHSLVAALLEERPPRSPRELKAPKSAPSRGGSRPPLPRLQAAGVAAVGREAGARQRSNDDLVATLASRLAQVEQQNKTLKDKLNKQTQEIEEMRSQLAAQGGYQSSGGGSLAEAAEAECKHLRKQVEVMKQLLAAAWRKMVTACVKHACMHGREGGRGGEVVALRWVKLTIEYLFGPRLAALKEVRESLRYRRDSPPAATLEDSFEGMPVDHEGASPHKRRASSQAGPPTTASVEQQGFLVAITDMLRGELQAGFATQQSRINEEIGEAMAKVNKRVEAVEKGVTKQLQQTLATIQDLAAKQEKQAVTLVQTGAETKQLVNRVLALEEQLAQLKKEPQAAGGSGDNPRRPAFIVGGWDQNQEARVTLDKAKQMLQELKIDVDLEGAFVPGLRRGYVIVPMLPRRDENGDDMRLRIQQAVQQVRAANITLGTRDDGSPSRLWMAVSQPPERRKRAQLAAKAKRLILEMDGNNQQLEVEWSSGSVWYKQRRVASAGGSKPEGAEEAGPGWINLRELSRQLGSTEEEVKRAWRPLAAHLR
ncbi:hypothetical protein AK812_SmicGene20497 [Symbiodinium microadriaticum]|uniref:Uncharacterized protein n=1 Tax=Symbiodinium microadriaticum TaxID=2951 RepID=A0A1Q9DPS5_SYMMI|nr:hypothetical protein AK812_SmicGene20497 [Symbiodinium microadriaticum]